MTASGVARGVDAHVHFWDPAALHYPWLADVPALEQPFLPDAYRAASGGDAVDGVVFVEANCLPTAAALETAFVERLATQAPCIAAVVAFADVAAHGAAALDRVARSPLVKGVRQNVQGHAPGYCLASTFVDGVREAGRRGLTFDLCATHDQLDDVIALVACCPETRFVLDHCGKPAIRDGALDPWRARIAALAAHDNVCCKLSGLLTEAAPGATFDDLAPYASHAAECFGTDRLLYGSDWPVLTLAGTLADWVAFSARFTAGWSASERAAFQRDNAVRVYGL